MKFQIRASVEKELWNGGTAFLYKVTDLDSERAKSWSVFTKEQLFVGSSYDLSGVVSESKDKKLKDQNQRDIWRATFNAESVNEIRVSNDPEPSFEDSFNSGDEIPF